MGARPLRRAIQRYIEDPLADFVLRAELTPGATVMVGRAPEGEDPEVTLTVVVPEKVPAAVGGGGETEEGTDAETPEEPAPPPPAADAEPS
jgi:ATP-dependent Clp protease ATP-binding subunit ClpC